MDQLLVRLVDAHRHDRAAVFERHLADVADLDPCHLHGLALARRHRLGGRHLDLELELVVAQERDPGRIGLALARKDHAGHERGEHDQGDDRQEVLRVLSDRAPHGAGTRSGAPVAAAGPFRLGTALVWQGTSIRNAGTPSGRAGWIPIRDIGPVAEVAGVLSGEAARILSPEELSAAARLEAEIRAVPVEGLARARELGSGVEKLLEVGLADVELGAGGIRGDLGVSGRDQVLRRAEPGQLHLREEVLARGSDLCESRRGLAKDPRRASQLLVAQEQLGLLEPRRESRDRVGELLEARPRLDRKRLQRRQRGVQGGQGVLGLVQGGIEQLDRAREVLRFAREGAGRDVQVGDEVGGLLLARSELLEHDAGRVDHLRQVSRALAVQGIGHDRRVAPRRAAVA